MRIAFLGLGRMGRDLASRLIDAGHDLTVWNRTAAAAESFAARATVASTTAEAVRGADVVITILFGPDTVRRVIVDSSLPIESGTLWIDLTSIGPIDAAWFARWAESKGIRYVHAPVVGSAGPAHQGTLGVLVGGQIDNVSAAMPIVSVWAAPGRLRTYETPAKAATAKLVANLTLAVAMQGMIEALRLGHAGGLTTGEVLDALDRTMLSAINDLKGDMVRSGEFTDVQYSASLLEKDARLMLHTSDEPLPALTVAFDALADAVRAGHGEEDFSVMASADRG